MKNIKLIFKFFSIIFIFSIFSTNSVMANNERDYFAKVQNVGTYLCSMPSETSAIFEIPATYFVKVNSVVDDYFKVTYQDIEGYVKKDAVKLMDGIPTMPFANATFKLFVPYAIYQQPDQTSISSSTIDTTSTLVYYGTKIGQQVSSNNNLWYYCKWETNGVVERGYIFSGVTDYLTKISTNTETFEIVSEEVLIETPSEFTELSTGTKVILIVAISVPSLLILYFLIKPSKIVQISKKRKSIQKENRKVKHGDYFEFDESQL